MRQLSQVLPVAAGALITELAFADGLPVPAVRLQFGRGEEVFGEGEPADAVYRVVSGAARSYRVLSDGRRQISEFHLAGDVFGLEGGAAHRLSAEAVGDAVIASVRRRTLVDMAGADRDMAARLFALTLAELERAQDHMLLLGRQSACERLCAFLVDLRDRQGDGAGVDLPMPRQDIADYLGLTIETVSRTLTQMQAAGWIALPSIRRVAFRDARALSRACG